MAETNLFSPISKQIVDKYKDLKKPVLIDIGGMAKSALLSLIDAPPTGPAFAATGECNPQLRVFCVNFDGTTNDFTNANEDENSSLIAKFHKDALKENGLAKNVRVQSIYVRGVATGGSLVMGSMVSDGQSLVPKMIEKISGSSCEERAQAAFDHLEAHIRMVRAVFPNDTFHLHVTGFSRGGATAIHFMNLVEFHGICNYPRSWPNRHSKSDVRDDREYFAIAPGHLPMSAVLIDCVITGKAESLYSGIPSSCVSALHLVADGEERGLFPVMSLKEGRIERAENVSSITQSSRNFDEKVQFGPPGSLSYKRLHEIYLPGARHSDVGGVYKEGGFREVVAYLASAYRASLGFDVEVNRPSAVDVQRLRANDSRFFVGKLIDFFKDRLTGESRTASGRRSIEVERIAGPRRSDNFDARQIKAPQLEILVSGDDVLSYAYPEAMRAFSLANEPSCTLHERYDIGDILLESIGKVPDSVVRDIYAGCNGRAYDSELGVPITAEKLEQYILDRHPLNHQVSQDHHSERLCSTEESPRG